MSEILPAVRLDGVRKAFRSRGKPRSLYRTLTAWLGRGADADATLLALDGLHFTVAPGERVGVIGDNGAGKTTMVRILAGADEQDTGQRNCRKDLRIAYGSQMPRMPPGTTVLALARRGTGEHDALVRRMRELEARMATGDEPAIAEYGHLQAAFEAGGGYDHDHPSSRCSKASASTRPAGRRTSPCSAAASSRACSSRS